MEIIAVKAHSLRLMLEVNNSGIGKSGLIIRINIRPINAGSVIKKSLICQAILKAVDQSPDTLKLSACYVEKFSLLASPKAHTLKDSVRPVFRWT